MDEVNVYPFGSLPETQEFALLATLPAAQISAALEMRGGLHAASRYLRIFVLDEPGIEDVLEYEAGDSFLAMRKSAHPELVALPRVERLRAIHLWVRQALEAAARTYGWSIPKMEEMLDLGGASPRFKTRTSYRYNRQRTLRVCTEFEITDEAVRRYTLSLEDRFAPLAADEHSERSFADFGTLRSDWKRSRWDSTGKVFSVHLLGGTSLQVAIPVDWIPRGRFERSDQGEPSRDFEEPPAQLPEHEDLSTRQFWQLIASLDGQVSDAAALERLTERLVALGEGPTRTFSMYLNEALGALDTAKHREQPIWDLTEESSEPPMSLSDDCFLYARCAVVGQGEEHWRRTVLEPSMMGGKHDLGAERLLYVTRTALDLL